METRPWGNRQTIQHRLTQVEIRSRKGGHTIQQREIRREMGDKWKQDLAKVDVPSNTGR